MPRANVFAYGSLMFLPVWSRVVEGIYVSQQAALSGFERRAVVGESYPVVIPSTTEQMVRGVLYYGVSTSDLKKLDQFEGNYYLRETVVVTLRNGDNVEAELYRLNPLYHHTVSDQPWSEDQFSQVHLCDFLRDQLSD